MKRIVIVICFALGVCFPVAAQDQSAPATKSEPPITQPGLPGANDELRSIFSAAGEAVLAGNFDEAIQIYDRGLKLWPKEPGFWVNKAMALISRGKASYNSGIFSSDQEVRKVKLDAALKDFKEALSASTRGLGLQKEITPPVEPHLSERFDSNTRSAARVHAEALWVLAVKDPSYLSASADAFREYLSLETDGEQKLTAQLQLSELLLRGNRFHEALPIFQSILQTDPDNVEANLGVAASLLTLAYFTNDKTNLQDGINYLARFVELAPDSHRVKGSAREALTYLRQPGSLETSIKLEANTGPAVQPGDSRVITGGVLNGKAITLPRPAYPLVAKFARAAGTVVVQVTIDEEGNVSTAKAINGHPLLRAASLNAARDARFSPTKLSGQPVRVTGVITYNFVVQ